VNVLSLFSGIGGLELGLERAGMTVVGQVEIDPFCQRVLAKHWTGVPQHDDVRTAAEWWRGSVRPAVHVVAGGPPCQGISRSGKRLGPGDERWGWPWLLDVVRVVRPRYVVVENPPALLEFPDAFGAILGELARLGFDAEWTVLPACAFGAPHTRERLFLVAHPAGGGFAARWGSGQGPALLESVRRGAEQGGVWSGESEPHGVAYGVPSGMDRRRALGNAVVPQVGEYVGRLLMAAAGEVAA
jgi:DNA (cytosine-5)-methyltransferase 1